MLPTAILIVWEVFFWGTQNTHHGEIARTKSTQWLLRRCDFEAGCATQQQTSKEEDHGEHVNWVKSEHITYIWLNKSCCWCRRCDFSAAPWWCIMSRQSTRPSHVFCGVCEGFSPPFPQKSMVCWLIDMWDVLWSLVLPPSCRKRPGMPPWYRKRCRPRCGFECDPRVTVPKFASRT